MINQPHQLGLKNLLNKQQIHLREIREQILKYSPMNLYNH